MCAMQLQKRKGTMCCQWVGMSRSDDENVNDGKVNHSLAISPSFIVGDLFVQTHSSNPIS